MTIPYRPLGIIKDMIETIGLEVTYSYEDLVFIKHNAFLLQMGDEGKDVAILFNTDSNPEARPEMLARLKRASAPLGLEISEGGLFDMRQEEGEESFQLELFGIDGGASS